MEGKSEFALLQQKIDQEVEMLHQLKSSFAQATSHEMIMHHYRTLDRYYAELVPYIGENAAIATICQSIEEGYECYFSRTSPGNRR